MATEATVEPIDETQLAGDNGEFYLFQWLSLLQKYLKEATTDLVKTSQASMEETLLKIIYGSNGYPLPGRGIRNLSARCFVLQYTRGETKTLFDTFRALLKIAGDPKASDKDIVRIAACWTIGELMAAFGSQFMSFMVEIATISLKIFRSSSSPQMRFHALTMLRKSLENAKKALTDTLTKDIIKNMKHGISDKALPVQRAAARVLITMFSPEESVSLSDAESVVTLCMKALDNSDQTTRQALAHLVGHVLAATQMARPVPAPEQQKGKKDVENADTSTPAYVVSEHLKPLLAPGEMLSQLSSHFNKANLSRRARAGIFDFYFALLTKLGTEFVENNYALIVGHLMLEVVSHPKNNATRYDRLFTRKVVGALLRDLIAVRMLSEQGQIAALQELSASYLRRWPALMPGQVAPSSDVLTVALTETAELLRMLGNAPPVVQDAVAEPLLTLLSHPSHSVRINASWALKHFCSSTPLRLPKTILSIMESLHRDIESLQSPAAPSDIDRRALGRAYGLAALVSTIPQRPLYVSFDIATNVLDMATQLLKRAVEHDVRIAGVEVEVAWILIASLMLLGPNFVRSHLSQLLVLWRNALPKTSNKDNSPGRLVNEWEFLLHVRESALGAILCFLLHNSPLVTLDVARRISSMLNNALAFTNAFASQIREEPVLPSTEAKGPTLRTRECLLRCRVYQCFTALGTSSLTESAQSSLLQSTLAVFAGPEGDGMSAMQASIASSSGFTSVWQTADGFGYGVTTIDIADDDTGCLLGTQTARLTNEQVEELTTLLLRKPVLGAREHDTLSLCLPGAPGSDSLWFDPPPSPTAVVNAAIELFARLLASQDLAITTRLVTQLTELVKSPKLDRNAGRKAAVVVNAAVATVQTLRHATTTYYRQARETLGHHQVTTALTGFLKDALVDGDPLLRRASSEVIGRLANISGTTFLTNQAKVLVDHIVSNRDPQGRAGCALAFGELYSHVGGLAAAPILKTTVNILMSLSNDPHPLVHYWSLTALAKVINAASLAFTPFVPSTLGMLVKIYMAEAHETEGGTLNNANLSGDLQAFPIVCRIIDAIITILGPDVDESSRTRSLVLDLVREFSSEEDEDILVEAIKCTQHLLMFASTHVDIPDAVFRFRSHLASNRRQLKLAAIDALYQLVQKDALVMSRLGGDGLVEDLFAMLDGDPGIQGVRSVIKSWLSQTAVHNPSAWIDLCLRIMLRTNAPQKTVDAAANLDDEGQSLNISTPVSNVAQEGSSTASTSRWRTQLFALECLHEICIAVAKSARREHTDVLFAKNRGLSVHGLLVSRIPDLIKMAFTASAAYVTEIRLEGLVVLCDVIQVFSKTPDPDYPEALLLEQHQAPITAALTPAFSSDSTPEILSAAIDACALFVGCGVVKDTARMGRILKQLTSALTEVNGNSDLKMGTLGELSPNASGMLRVSILAAWARLEIASTEQTYLLEIIKPYREILASQWVACLRDYATIRADSEFVYDSSVLSLDPSFANLGKVVLLPYYHDTWATILQAVANAMDRADGFVAAAILGQDPNSNINGTSTARAEPAPLFYVIFGLVYEALATVPSQPTNAVHLHSNVATASLGALKSLIDPRYSGKALLEPAIFREFFNLCHRIVMTENAATLVHLLAVVRAFCKHFGHLGIDGVAVPNEVLPADSVRAQCLKICAYVLRHVTHSQEAPAIAGSIQELAKMIGGALSSFELVAATTVGNIREDVRGIGCVLYAELLKDETLDMDLITPTLPAFKALLSVEAKESTHNRYDQLIHGLVSSCLLNIDDMRGREGSVCTRKVNTNMLAAVVILTSIPPRVKIANGVVEHLAHLICQKLEESDDMAMIAVHCTKTLTVAAAGSDVLRSCSRQLLPALVQYVARLSPRVDDDTLSDQQRAAIEEVYKAFAALLSLVTGQNRTRMLCIILPTITLLLRPSLLPAPSIHSSAVSQLLTLAASSPTSFKEAAAQLDPKVREVLELSIRKAVEGTPAAAQSTAKPQISLRSF
ncbi:armadillo-type protein [Pisolithus albus]|nr:armadillo-type protein [Pisolithus albus]